MYRWTWEKKEAVFIELKAQRTNLRFWYKIPLTVRIALSFEVDTIW